MVKEVKDNLIFNTEIFQKTSYMIGERCRCNNKKKRRKGGSDHRGAGIINEIIPVSTV